MTSETGTPSTQIPTLVAQATLILTAIPSVLVNHRKKPERFNGVDFKRQQHEMLYYLKNLNLARFSSEDAPVVVAESEQGRPRLVELKAISRDASDLNLKAMISQVNMVGSNLQEWWVDNRATHHICGDKKMFTSLEPVTIGEMLYMGKVIGLEF